jgi:hypothetical protein
VRALVVITRHARPSRGRSLRATPAERPLTAP